MTQYYFRFKFNKIVYSFFDLVAFYFKNKDQKKPYKPQDTRCGNKKLLIRLKNI